MVVLPAWSPFQNARPADGNRTQHDRRCESSGDRVAALLAQRDEKIAELGAKLDAVLQILGAGKSGDIIIDLPKNFWRRDAA